MFEESKRKYREAVQAYLKANEGKLKFPFINIIKKSNKL